MVVVVAVVVVVVVVDLGVAVVANSGSDDSLFAVSTPRSVAEVLASVKKLGQGPVNSGPRLV